MRQRHERWHYSALHCGWIYVNSSICLLGAASLMKVLMRGWRQFDHWTNIKTLKIIENCLHVFRLLNFGKRGTFQEPLC